MIEPADDYRHTLTGRPFDRESIFHNLHLPEHGISGFLYTWVEADDKAGYVVTFFGNHGEQLCFERRDNLPVTGMDFDAWSVGGLTLRHTKALEVAEVSYRGDGAAVDLTFTALHRPFSYRENADGCPAWAADDRFEQSGTVEGFLELGDKRIEFATTAHRDHSWGPRDWDSIHHWKWISGQAGPDITFNAMQTFALGRVWTNGYVHESGDLWPIDDIAVTFDYDETFRHTEVAMTFRGAEGRSLDAQVTRYAVLPYAPGGQIVMHEAGCVGHAAGRDAIVHVEMGWPAAYVAHQQQALSR